jgi:hypothetical protein
MALAFADIIGPVAPLPTTFVAVPGWGSFNPPPLTPGQAVTLRSWMATASNFDGTKLSPAQIGRLVLYWSYCLGCSATQIYTYASANQ